MWFGFSTWTHLGHKSSGAISRNILGFYEIREEFGQFLCNAGTRHHENKCSRKRTEKHYARATNDNSFHNNAGWHTYTHIPQSPKWTCESMIGGLRLSLSMAARRAICTSPQTIGRTPMGKNMRSVKRKDLQTAVKL